jgi:hypothetical protein
MPLLMYFPSLIALTGYYLWCYGRVRIWTIDFEKQQLQLKRDTKLASTDYVCYGVSLRRMFL